jgi:hypothetical protein
MGIYYMLEFFKRFIHVYINKTPKFIEFTHYLSLSFEKRVLNFCHQMLILGFLLIKMLQIILKTISVEMSLIIKLGKLEINLSKVLSETVVLTFYLVLKVASNIFLNLIKIQLSLTNSLIYRVSMSNDTALLCCF